MSKALVLTEKPSVARDIARVLKCTKKGSGFLEGDRYIVTWALGHLVTLADPEMYGEQYKQWRIEDLPMLFPSLKLVVIKQSGKQFQAVKAQMNRKDVHEIIIATDAGREGELVARWIIEKANVKKQIKRLWISSVTDKAIREGFNKLQPGQQYQSLYAAAVARSEADWYVGINATRALTCKFNAQLSCGRVQTPTLTMIASREEEIKHFKPQVYYGIRAIVDGDVCLTWQNSKTKQQRLFDKNEAVSKLEALKEQNAIIQNVEKKHKKSLAPQLYNLTELQRDAHKRYSFSAKETLSIMQGLYEHHKLLTYPRTDSRYLSTDIVETLRERLQAITIGPFTKYASKLLKSPIHAHKGFVDNTKVSDHHAIIPTEQAVNLSKLSDKERKVYDLVVKRFLAVLSAPHEYEQITLTALIGKETFIARGQVVKQQGWKEIYQLDAISFEDEDEQDNHDNHSLPPLQKGDNLQVKSLSLTDGKTKPPAPFNEASLLSAMENPIKFMAGEHQSLIKTLGQTGGIGTVATRADIIEKLFNSFLIEKRGEDIFTTSKGRQLLDLVPEELKSPALTAEWEQRLEQIAKGSLKKEAFLHDIKAYAANAVKEIKMSAKSFKHDNITGKQCPECHKPLLEVNGKKGKMHVCQDRECGFRKTVSRLTNARCPQCRKKLELHGEGEGQIFVCVCGHREKLSSFEARKKKETHKASKHEVNKYLKQQQKEEEFVNPALAEALKKLKLK
jgi:DNA topoisomerase-3